MKREREEDERDIIDISSDSGSDSASSDGEDELPGHQNSLFAEDESDDEDATMGGDSDDEGNYAAKEEEDLEDVVDDSAPRRSPSVAPAERGDVLVNLLNDRTPEETGPSFNALPLDIKYLLLGYLDTEPYSVYSLSMVSRSWYKALNQDSSTEDNQIGLQSCSECQKIPGPWQTIPEKEAQRRNPRIDLSALPFRAIRNPEYPGNPGIKNPNKKPKKYIKLYLASSIGDPFDGFCFLTFAKRRQRLLGIHNFEFSGKPELQKGFMDILGYMEAADVGKAFRSNRLTNMTLALVEGEEMRMKASLNETCRDAIEYLEKVKLFNEELESRKASQPHIWAVAKDKTTTGMRRPTSRSWGDSIITGTATWEELEEILRWKITTAKGKMCQDQRTALRAKHREKNEELFQAYKSGEIPIEPNMLKWYKREQRKRNKEAHRGAERQQKQPKKKKQKTLNTPASTAGVAPRVQTACQSRAGCGNKGAVKCPHRCCKTCCPGPCNKHQLQQRIDIYQAKAEEMEWMVSCMA